MSPKVAKVARWLKVGGALALLACYALPMSSCTPFVFKSAETASVPAAPIVEPRPPAAREQYDILTIDPTEPGEWVRVFAFAAPALILLYARKYPSGRATRALWLVEPLFMALVLLIV